MKALIMISLIILTIQTSSSLEVDEKLTTRILKASGTKKTLLINRGLEDGLVVGDHAKFFLTTGVIARGVVVKASPSRSIWSIYRIIDADKIFQDRVVNIKISNQLKTSEDPTRSLAPERYAQGKDVIVIPEEARGEVQTRGDLTDAEKEDIASLGQLPTQVAWREEAGISYQRTLEMFGMIHFNSLTASSDLGSDGSSTGELAKIDLSFGLEKYLQHGSGLLNQMSGMLFVHRSVTQASSVDGTQVSNTVLEYGAGLNWHYIAPPLSYNRVIGFAQLTAGIGNSQDTVSFNSGSSNSADQSFDGSSSFFSMGTGLKYYSKDGFGGRGIIDYYRRTESYVVQDLDENYTKVVSGFRVMLGMSYRF